MHRTRGQGTKAASVLYSTGDETGGLDLGEQSEGRRSARSLPGFLSGVECALARVPAGVEHWGKASKSEGIRGNEPRSPQTMGRGEGRRPLVLCCSPGEER